MKRRTFLKFLCAAPIIPVVLADKVMPPMTPRLQVIDEAHTYVGEAHSLGLYCQQWGRVPRINYNHVSLVAAPSHPDWTLSKINASF